MAVQTRHCITSLSLVTHNRCLFLGRRIHGNIIISPISEFRIWLDPSPSIFKLRSPTNPYKGTRDTSDAQPGHHHSGLVIAVPARTKYRPRRSYCPTTSAHILSNYFTREVLGRSTARVISITPIVYKYMSMVFQCFLFRI
uniref:Uncharacterized protein n=1 Tax=Heterorhabditis bacteriophora TaxID=37862 RepID=A0A1I7WN90_HETBA